MIARESYTPQVLRLGISRYKNIIPAGKHIRGDHAKELKTGPISNQTIEGAFSLFKRGVVGNYHKLGIEHMDAHPTSKG